MIICVIPLIFGILLVADVFDVTDNIKYGVGVTILVIGSLGCCISGLITIYGACCGDSGGGGGSKPPDVRMAALMLTVQSGMNLTERYDFKSPDNNVKIDKQLLIKMLKQENDLRLSTKIIEKYENEAIEYYDNIDPNRDCLNKVFLSEVVNDLQKKVVNEFGFGSKNQNEEKYALEYLRSAMALYPDDESIKNAANYLKYNLAKKFPFNMNDFYVDINLLDLNGKLIKLSQIIKKNVLNVIISGSIT